MEASIMNGEDLKCGAVSLLNNIKNPISIAIDIMNTTNHIYMVGDGVKQHINYLLLNDKPCNYYENLKREAPKFENDKYFWSEKRWSSYKKIKKENEINKINKTIRSEDEDELDKKYDGYDEEYDDDDDIFEGNTVGCVVMLKGNVAAATSTGGMTYKLDGRIGDTPIIGSGTYADNKYGAVSCTGIGEEFIKHVTAYDIIARVKYCKTNLKQAIEDHLNENFEKGTGGAIAINKNGQYGIAFNTTGMIRGYFNSNDKEFGEIAILKDDQQKVEWNKQLSREQVDQNYEGSDDDDNDDHQKNKSNPYLDSNLMESFQAFSPNQNKQFVSTHSVSNK